MPETEEETTQVMRAWENWYGELGTAVADPGYPFTPVAKSIASNGVVSDGPAGAMASEYIILEAGSLDEAVKMAQGCPVLLGGAENSVFETFEEG